MTTKADLRAAVRRQLAALDVASRAQESAACCARLASIPGDVVMAYLALDDEVSVDAFVQVAIDAGRRICVPSVDWATKTMQPVHLQGLAAVEPDARGIRTPPPDAPVVDPAGIDCIIVPGVAFSRDGARLGRGGGFYDRLLAVRTPGTAAIGVAFRCQIVDNVPCERHDMRVDTVITAD